MSPNEMSHPESAERARQARKALDAFAEVTDHPGGSPDKYGPAMVTELISALLDHVQQQDSPAYVLAAALGAYDNRVRTEGSPDDDFGFEAAAGHMIAAVLEEVKKATLADPLGALSGGLSLFFYSRTRY
ncbi:hypothetical protein [Actinomadura litoris]|uniref:hypothetical protein n=1 Tax=Actinomadura litoris TaxID=2678616 RepID=UPI001FA73C24|nr:hypothetical protein [Actinomadura litoris]